MILAIVGTRKLALDTQEYARLIITCEVTRPDPWGYYWDSFITGDAGGIDEMVKDICDDHARPCQVLAPEQRRWEPGGYKIRNTHIAEGCDKLLAIRDLGESATYGSGWTADHAETLGKPVRRIHVQ